jgi:uncharacterized membrane protein
MAAHDSSSASVPHGPPPSNDALAERVAALERQVHYLTWRMQHLGPSAQAPSIPPLPPIATPTAPLHDRTPPAPTPSAQAAVSSETWILRVGVLLLSLGLLTLFRYSIERDWIGPLARVAAGALTGALLFTIGLFKQRARPLFAGLLHAAGCLAWLIALFAAWRHYGLISLDGAWAGSLVVLALGTALALWVRQPAPALAASLGCTVIITQVIFPECSASNAVPFSALLLPVVGAGVSARLDQRFPLVFALGLTLFWALGAVMESPPDLYLPAVRLVLASVVPAALASGAWSILHGKRDKAHVEISAIVVLFGTLTWMLDHYGWRPSGWLGGFTPALALALPTGLVAWMLGRRGQPAPVLAWAAISAVALALSFRLPGPTWVLSAFAFATALHAGGALPAVRSLAALGGVATLLGIVGIFFQILLHVDSSTTYGAHRAVWMCGLAWMVAQAGVGRGGPWQQPLGIALYGYILLASAGVLHAWGPGPILASVVWAVVATGALVLGIRSHRDLLRQLGLATIAALVAKILIFDLQGQDTLWRVLALLGMGGVFLLLGYLVPGLLGRGRGVTPAVDPPPAASSAPEPLDRSRPNPPPDGDHP